VTTPDQLAATHPEYASEVRKANFCLAAYAGGPDFVTAGNLFRHFRENPADYEDRLLRAYYTNYCRAVVRSYLNHISRRPPYVATSAALADTLGEFTANVDRRGTTLTEFLFEQLAPLVLAMGWCGVLVDEPRKSPRLRSLADDREARVFPYLAIVTPDRITNWDIDEFGNFNWVRIRQPIQSDPDPLAPMARRAGFEYLTWTREQWFVHDADANLAASGSHNLRRVPLVVVYTERNLSREIAGVGLLNDIAYINREILNISSLIQEFLYRQCFNILAVPGRVNAAGEGTESFTLGVSNLLEYDAGSNGVPSYITPPTDPAEYLQKEREILIAEIYRTAIIADFSDANVRAQSGLSKEFDFHNANRSLAKIASNWEKATTKLLQIAFAWLGLEGETAVEFNKEFNIRDIAADLANALAARNVGLGPRAWAEIRKRVARTLLPGVGEKVMADIDRQIESASATSAAQQNEAKTLTG